MEVSGDLLEMGLDICGGVHDADIQKVEDGV